MLGFEMKKVVATIRSMDGEAGPIKIWDSALMKRVGEECSFHLLEEKDIFFLIF